MVLANLFLGGIVKSFGILRVALLTTESLKELLNSWSGGSRFVDGTFGYRPVTFDSKIGGVN